jgi:uncharacterized membrane protein YhaH (DUF805 family)
MFRSPFLFSGRITRTEFGFTLIIFNVFLLVFFLTMLFVDSRLFFKFICILLLVAIWFRVAQTTKRCHDVGISGWYQLIPFYTIVLLFEKGKTEPNRYGVSPKVIIVDEICKIISIQSFSIIVELNNGKILTLENVSLPKYAKEGDLIQHTDNGHYIVVDKVGNMVFRM